MIIKEIGEYRLLKDFYTRGSFSCEIIPKGTVILITHIDEKNHKVIGPSLNDWTFWDLPVEGCNKIKYKRKRAKQ